MLKENTYLSIIEIKQLNMIKNLNYQEWGYSSVVESLPRMLGLILSTTT
jgi:hypothetical protein